MKITVLLFLFFCSYLAAPAQNDTLRGTVTDRKQHPVSSANVYLKSNPSGGTISGEDGSFRLKWGGKIFPDTLIVSFIGYRTAYIPLTSGYTGQLLSIVLQNDDQELMEITVKANPSLSREFSIEKVSRLDIYNNPAAAGDPLKMVSTLAASTNTAESAEPELRGSSGAMSRVVLNGVPVYNPVRNSRINGPGNFSLFNTEILESQDVYAGNPPLTYSNATAGLVELKTASKLPSSFTQTAISLCNAGLLRAQSLGKASFLQMYGNYQFSSPYLHINYHPYVRKFRSADAGVNLHTDFRPSLSLNLFSYVIDERFTSQNYMYNYEGEMQAGKKRNFHILNLKYRHNRTVFAFNGGLDIARSHYSFGNIRARQNETSCYADLHVKQFWTAGFYLQGGFSYSYENTAYRGVSTCYPYAVAPEAPTAPFRHRTEKTNPEFYLYARWNPLPHLTLGGGIRKNLPTGHLSPYCCWQGNARYSYGNHALLLAAGHYHGYSVPGYELREYTPVSSRQYSLEYRFHRNGTDIQAAVYLKQEKHIAYFNVTGNTSPSRYRIVGAEASASHSWNRLNASVAYTFLYARQKIEERWYNAANRMNYFLKLSFSYTSPSWGRISLFSLLRSGLYYTPVLSGLWHAPAANYRPVYGPFHSRRLPAYATFDLSYNKVFTFPKHYLVVFASLLNLSDRRNKATPRYLSDYSATYGYTVYSRRALYFGIQYNF